MSLQDRESLSALLDNETDDLELRRLLKSSEQDSSLLDTWQCYNLAQAILHDELPSASHQVLRSDFSTKVAQAIAEESALEMPSTTGSNPPAKWQYSLSKVAIAASVAAVFIVGVQISLDQNTAPEVVQGVGDPAGNSAVAPEQVDAQLADTPITVDPVAQQRLREYIQSVSITPDEPSQLEYLQDSPLFRLVNELEDRDQ